MTTKEASASVWTLYRPRQRWFYLAILFLVCLSNYIDRNVMSVLIEPIKTEFKVSDAMMGLLTGFAFAAFYAVLGIPVARLADRGDRRKVITVSLVVFSIMTMLCGFARSFWLLALARTGVGAGEAGAIPPAQSLIADYFPPAQRSRALATYMSSATVGYVLAFSVGAWLAENYGWRAAFIALSAPGLLLAAVTFLGLSEPRHRFPAAAGAPAQEPFTATLAALFSKPSYVSLNIAIVLYFLVAYGVLTWYPAYMGRVLHLKLSQIGGVFGAISALSTLLGTLGGGWLTDALAKRDPRWTARLPGAILIASFPLFEIGLASDDVRVFLATYFITGLGIGAAVPAMFTVLHRICGSGRRSIAVAIVFFLSNLLGLGFGPLITGALSDRFSAAFGQIGLRYALMTAVITVIPCGAALWMTSRTLTQDAED
jgi:predicted MFS family arabinose efflux permease